MGFKGAALKHDDTHRSIDIPMNQSIMIHFPNQKSQHPIASHPFIKMVFTYSGSWQIKPMEANDMSVC